MDYLIRFIQVHESFRKAETEALAELFEIEIEWVLYSENSPFAILRFPSHPNPPKAARQLISRSILSSAIYELWGTAQHSSPQSDTSTLYTLLHQDVRARSSHLWPTYHHSSFRFTLDSFQGSHTTAQQRDIIETFSYTNFAGRIRMSDPDQKFVVFETFHLNDAEPHALHLGRWIADSGRKAINKYNLKKRSYIATTSMDAELSLVTANLAHAAEGKLAYDPFVGTGSFPLACAHFGAGVFGSDLDGRSIRGKGVRSVKGNFVQYGTLGRYLGGFVADLTNSPLRLPLTTPSSGTSSRFLDAILADPPYGVREGLKVLGSTKVALQEVVLLQDGSPAHLSDTYVPPKRAYSFTRMLDDVLDFAALGLVDGGRLCMWMPVAGAVGGEEGGGEEAEGRESDGGGDRERDRKIWNDRNPDVLDKEYTIPSHPALQLVSECTQHFNKWSRRLLTYRRIPDAAVDTDALQAYRTQRLEKDNTTLERGTADSMNEFRRKYFQGFRDPEVPGKFERLPRTY